MLFSRRSATFACAIALVVMAVTPYHRFSSSIGLASGAMTWLVILGACLAAFVHGAALCKGGMRRPRHLGAIGVFLGVIATVPEWADLAFYARGDSIPIVFAPIWLLHGVSCVSCFVGSLLLSYVIWGTADSPLTQRSTRTDERETRHPQDAIFTETIAVMSCLLFCCRVSWRVVPEPWGMSPVTAASIGLMLLIPLVYLMLAVAPLLCCPRAFGRGQGDVFARSVLVAVPIGLVPAVEEAYFASDATVIASLSTGSAIAVAAFVYTLLREKRDNNSDTPRTSDPFDAGVFSPALSLREEQFVRLLLKGKTPAEIARETGTKPSTVRTTLHRAYGKASVSGSRELVALFAGEGDAVGPEMPQRHADDMLASARTRRLFRYLLTLFFILLAAGPLVMADSDWGSGVTHAIAFSLASYTLGLGLLLSLCSAGGKPKRGDDLDGADGAIGLGSPCVWAILSAVEWSFVYIAAWRCVRDPLMAAPVLFCGIASMASLAVKLRPFKVHAHTRAITLLVSIGVAALIYATTRGRIHGLAVLTGMLLTYILCCEAFRSAKCSGYGCFALGRRLLAGLSCSIWRRI